jgi:hypothetical protein
MDCVRLSVKFPFSADCSDVNPHNFLSSRGGDGSGGGDGNDDSGSGSRFRKRLLALRVVSGRLST